MNSTPPPLGPTGTRAAGHSTDLQLSGTYGYFAVAADLSGGVTVSESATPCYCPGTLILTDPGEVPVEAVSIGDRAVTLSGRIELIRWIGRRAYAGRFLAGKRHLLPIRIAAGALGEGLPRRDPRVSPLHALYIERVLVPAWLLMNGTSIVQERDRRSVQYLHVELAAHDVIWAEGAPAETFLDDDSRGMFENAAEPRTLYPEAGAARQYCAPRVEDGPKLEAIRAQLVAISGRTRHAA